MKKEMDEMLIIKEMQYFLEAEKMRVKKENKKFFSVVVSMFWVGVLITLCYQLTFLFFVFGLTLLFLHTRDSQSQEIGPVNYLEAEVIIQKLENKGFIKTFQIKDEIYQVKIFGENLFINNGYPVSSELVLKLIDKWIDSKVAALNKIQTKLWMDKEVK